MKQKGKRIISTIPDSKVWNSFLEHIENIHGKTYGYIGVEVQNALKQYVEEYNQPDAQDLVEGYKRKMEDIKKDCAVKVEGLEKRLQVSEMLVRQTKALKDANQSLESKVKLLESENGHLQALQETHNRLYGDYGKLRNNYDHLQARFNKSQKELNVLERENSDLRVVVAKIGKMSFIERLLNRLPSEVKQLTTKKKEVNQ